MIEEAQYIEERDAVRQRSAERSAIVVVASFYL